MSYGSFDAWPCTGIVLSMPRVGRWVASVSIQDDDDAHPSNSMAELLITASSAVKQRTLMGTLVSSSRAFGITVGNAWGGRGGLQGKARAQHYRSTSVRRVLGDLLDAAGEKLADDADAALLEAQLVDFVQVEQPIGTAIGRLLRSAGVLGAAWRFNDAGGLWAGVERWRPYPGDFDLISVEPIENAMVVDFPDDAQFPQPGMTLDGRKLGRIEHRLDGGGLTTKVFFE